MMSCERSHLQETTRRYFGVKTDGGASRDDQNPSTSVSSDDGECVGTFPIWSRRVRRRLPQPVLPMLSEPEHASLSELVLSVPRGHVSLALFGRFYRKSAEALGGKEALSLFVNSQVKRHSAAQHTGGLTGD